MESAKNELEIPCYDFLDIDNKSYLTVSVIPVLAVNSFIFQIYCELT